MMLIQFYYQKAFSQHVRRYHELVR